MVILQDTVLASYLEQTHVKEELQNSEDRNIQVNVHGHPTAPHVLPFLQGVDFLSANDSEDEEDIGGQCHYLGVDHGNGDPVITPQ